MRPLVIAGLLAAGASSLYLWEIGTTPPSLAEDEVTIAMTAHSLATTGKDLFGRSWPLYMQITDGSWFHPVIVYSIALVLQVLPLSEFAIRLPTVCTGVANVVLMYFAARVLFTREAPAVLAAILLALTPTHFLHSRFALEYLYPLPFISAWLLCLFTYLERGDARWLFASTLALGLGFYSYIASVLVMPIYVTLTSIALLLRKTPVRTVALAIAGFLLPVSALFVPWLFSHRSAFGDTVSHYLIYDASRLNPVQGARELLSHSSIAARASTYWGYLNPSFLFLDLTAPSMFSTRTTGVFLLPLALFVPVALYQAFRSRHTKHVVLVLGFLTAPLAAVLVGEAGAIGRALELLPFGIMLAVVGIVHLWSGPHVRLRRVVCLSASSVGIIVAVVYAAWTLLAEGRISGSTPVLLLFSAALAVAAVASDRVAWRMAVVALLAAGIFEFQQYLNDYFSDYRARVSEAFLFNRRGGLEYLIERSRLEDIPAVYLKNLDRDVDVIDLYWRFYLSKHGQEDLRSRTVILGESDAFDATTLPTRSIILARAADPAIQALASAGELTLETLIPEPSGHPFFAVFRR